MFWWSSPPPPFLYPSPPISLVAPQLSFLSPFRTTVSLCPCPPFLVAQLGLLSSFLSFTHSAICLHINICCLLRTAWAQPLAVILGFWNSPPLCSLLQFLGKWHHSPLNSTPKSGVTWHLPLSSQTEPTANMPGGILMHPLCPLLRPLSLIPDSWLPW